MRRPFVALLAAACVALAAGVQAYPGADAGPKPWKPQRGKPIPTAQLAVLPPTALTNALMESGLPLSSLGLYARQVDGKRVFAALNEEQPFVLASTAKVVTTLAALDLLGPTYQWNTFAFTKGELVDGQLHGDLLIVGGGNGALTSEAMLRWFERMHAQGLREIQGNIVLDRLAFSLDAVDLARTPVPAPGRPYHAWPDALTLDEGVLRVDVVPQAAGRPQVLLTPPLTDVQLDVAMGRGPGCFAYAQMASAPAAPSAPLKLTIRGATAPGCGVQHITFVPLSHAEFTTRAIGELWRRAGGTLAGRVVDRSGPSGSAVLQKDAAGGYELPFSMHGSELLPEVVREINKNSNNMLARNLLLTLAPGFPLQTATLDAARQRVQQWLLTQGLATGDVEVDSGSGLSRSERGKPRAMAQLLAQAWRGRTSKFFFDSLPVAGVDGTLFNRFQQSPVSGKAFMKTGTLQDSRALAGYVKARSGKVYAVALMVNHPDAALAMPVLDALVEWIYTEG